LTFPLHVNRKELCLLTAFYAKGAEYHIFAGKDCSVNLARTSLDLKLLNQYNPEKASFTKQEIETLKGWSERLKAKYPVVGTLKD